MLQSPFDPETYLELMAAEVPDWTRLQVEVAGATAERIVRQFLDLGIGAGMTALGVLSVHPDAEVVGIPHTPSDEPTCRSPGDGG